VRVLNALKRRGGRRHEEKGTEKGETGAEPTICRESQERNTSRSARNEISQRILIQERRSPSEEERGRERASARIRPIQIIRAGREIFRDGIAFSGYAAPVFLDIRCRVTHSRRNIDRYLIVKYCSSRCVGARDLRETFVDTFSRYLATRNRDFSSAIALACLNAIRDFLFHHLFIQPLALVSLLSSRRKAASKRNREGNFRCSRGLARMRDEHWRALANVRTVRP